MNHRDPLQITGKYFPLNRGLGSNSNWYGILGILQVWQSGVVH